MTDNRPDGASAGGYIPPDDDGSPLKFWIDVSFKNTTAHGRSGLSFSAPPAAVDYDQWTVPAALARELDEVVEGFLGAGRKLELDTYRICW